MCNFYSSLVLYTNIYHITCAVSPCLVHWICLSVHCLDAQKKSYSNKSHQQFALRWLSMSCISILSMDAKSSSYYISTAMYKNLIYDFWFPYLLLLLIMLASPSSQLVGRKRRYVSGKFVWDYDGHKLVKDQADRYHCASLCLQVAIESMQEIEDRPFPVGQRISLQDVMSLQDDAIEVVL